MTVFNRSHVTLIEQRIKLSGLTNPQLIEDMVDHYCCLVEEEMDKGVPFEEAYKRAWNCISPNGLVEIEHELFLMLNFNKHIQMKKLMYLAGFMTAMFIASGFLFRILHWPGAMAINFLGYAFLFITCVMIVVSRFFQKKPSTRSEQVRIYAGNLTALFISVGSMFKTFSFPGANIMLLIGFIMLILVYLPAFFYHAYRISLSEH